MCDDRADKLDRVLVVGFCCLHLHFGEVEWMSRGRPRKRSFSTKHLGNYKVGWTHVNMVAHAEAQPAKTMHFCVSLSP